MKTLRKQRGFLLNPYRFAGTVQSGAFTMTGESSAVMVGAAIASATVSGEADAALTVHSDQGGSGALSAAGEASMTMVGAAVASADLSSDAEASFTAVSQAAALTCDAADFDGTNDRLTKGSYTSQADSKSGILAAWVQFDSLTGQRSIFGGVKTSDSTIVLDFIWSAPGGVIYIEANDGSGTIFRLETSGITISTGSWYSILASWDMASSSTHLYINDVDRKSVAAGPNDRTLILASVTEWTVGDYSPTDGGGALLDGGLAELYFAPGQYIDFSVEDNRRRFITSGVKPVDLGATGSVPTGTAPLVYLHLDDAETANNFAVNAGTGGNMTVTGAITTRATSPSD